MLPLISTVFQTDAQATEGLIIAIIFIIFLIGLAIWAKYDDDIQN